MPSTPRTGGQILMDQLAIHGVDTIFSVPGESFLPALDALIDTPQIRLITCRQEGGAAFAADAYGKLTGRPGVCFVTRGPGASNAAIGLHTARQDSTPLLLLIGQVARGMRDREAFQEIEYRQLFLPLAKYVAEVDDPRRLPEFVARAMMLAVSGRPGPVVLSLPEDMLAEVCAVPDAILATRVQASPGAGDMARLRDLLTCAARPLLIVGGGDWTAHAAADITAFAEANALPVAAAFRAQDIVDNQHPVYIGDLAPASGPQLIAQVQSSDLIICAGDRLSEIVTRDYTLFGIPTPAQPLIHIHPDPGELGRVYQPTLAIVSGMPEFAAATRALAPVDASKRTTWGSQLRAAYLAQRTPPAASSGVDLGAVVLQLRARLPEDAIISNGAGNYALFVQRYFTYRQYRTQLAPVNGAMGYGVPAAITAALVHPGRMVVAFAGDGCFLMSGQELATAVQQQLQFLVIVVNNGRYGTIRSHQERHYPGRVVGTALINPDFAAYARAFGCYGERVETTDAFPAALERALAYDGVALLELVTE